MRLKFLDDNNSGKGFAFILMFVGAIGVFEGVAMGLQKLWNLLIATKISLIGANIGLLLCVLLIYAISIYLDDLQKHYGHKL